MINYIAEVPDKSRNLLYKLIPRLDEFDVSICGGFPRRLILKVHNPFIKFNYNSEYAKTEKYKVPDIDIWPRSQSAFDSIRTYLEELKIPTSHQTITYAPVTVNTYHFIVDKVSQRVQIMETFGHPYDIIQQFDFTNSQCCLANKNQSIVALNGCHEALINGWLVPNKNATHYHGYRMAKFLGEGFKLKSFDDYLYLINHGDEDLKIALSSGAYYKTFPEYFLFKMGEKEQFMLNALNFKSTL